MCLDIAVEPCQKIPVHLGKPWHGFHGAVRQSCPGRICFRGPPRCVAVRIAVQKTVRSTCTCTRSSRRLRSRAAASWRRDRRWPQRGCGPAARAPPCAPVRRARVGWTIAEIVFWPQCRRLSRLDKLSPALLAFWQNAAGFHFGFRKEWNFVGAQATDARWPEFAVEFPCVRRDRGKTSRRTRFPTRLNPALKSGAILPVFWLLPSRATSPVSSCVPWLVSSLVFWPGPRRVSPGTCRICSRAA